MLRLSIIKNAIHKINTGMVSLSLMSVAPVCRVGESLQMNCTASLQFVKWSILQADEQGTLVKVTNDVKSIG